MKLQFNLLPDVKLEYLKTKKTKRTVITACLVASTISFFILMIMITTVYVVNKKQLSDADKQIKTQSQKLQGVKNLDKILTIQNQLNSIQKLHQSKHKMSRVFTYLPEVTPAHVCIGQLSIDTSANTMSVQGTADSQKSVNTFIDTLKFTKFKTSSSDSGNSAFTSVIENQFTINSPATLKNVSSAATCQGAQAPAAYQLTFQFDPTLFSNSSDPVLDVPQGLVTTRSVLDDPSNLFNGTITNPSTQTNNSSTGGQ